MGTPAVAVLWESWRLTRRRLLLVPAVTASCLLWPAKGSPAFVLMVFAALGMAFSLPMFGTGAGFPLSKAFARPIHTWVLVAVPLGYVGIAAAACYLVPVAVLRAFTGEPFPLTSFATLIGTVAVLVAASAWFTRDTALRTGAAIAAYLIAGLMYKLLDPFRDAGHFPLEVGPRLCQLSGAGYLAVTLFVVCIYLVLVWAVGRQRHGEDEVPAPRAATDDPGASRGDILTWIRNTCADLLRWRCPVSSPAAAETWFELQYYGIAVLAIGLLLALCVPLLLSLGNAHRSGIPLAFAASTVLAPLLAAVSASIWNRHRSARFPVSAFEAARPVGTAQLVGLRLLVTTACVAVAWLFIIVSFWVSLPLLSDMYPLQSPAALAQELARRYGMRLASVVAVSFTLLATLFGLLAALRAFVSLYGWRIWSGALALVVYALSMAIGVSRGLVGGAVIGVHIWAVAIAIPVGTLFVFGRALSGHVLTPRQALVAALAWAVFAALYLDLLHPLDVLGASAALAALAFASALLPLLAVALAPWSISLVRHA